MARKPRGPQPRGWYHVTTLGVARSAIVRTDHDREVVVALTIGVFRAYGWRCEAFCLMDTHYHFLALVTDDTLALGMQRLNGSYASGFNRRYGRIGHVFAGRYCAIPIQGDGHLLEVVRYIAMNPVRAGACERPEHWPWSSYSALLRADVGQGVEQLARVPSFLPKGRRGVELLRAFVAEGRRVL